MTSPEPLVRVFGRRMTGLGFAPGARVSGLPLLALPLVLIYLHEAFGLPVLSALKENEHALTARDRLAGLGLEGEVAFYPGQESTAEVPPGFVSPMEGFRLSALACLGGEKQPPYVLLTEETLQQGLPSEQAIHQAQLIIRPGSISYAEMRLWLEDNGYEYTSLVVEPGTYALRGSIIDCYPVNSDVPLRIDFMDDEIEEMRDFDVHTQISTRTRSSAAILSLQRDEADRVAVTDHFPDGWILIRQDGDRWILTSNEDGAISQEMDLRIDPFDSRGTTGSVLQARWDFLKKRHESPGAYFADGREAQYERAKALLPQVPLALAGGAYPAGFTSDVLGFMLITPTELWGRRTTAWKPQRKQIATLSSIRQHVESLEPGNPLVHINYGIGRYIGLSQISVGGTQQECMPSNTEMVTWSTFPPTRYPWYSPIP
jgi:transcription-repair coupling factor (superfamily II helicase)